MLNLNLMKNWEGNVKKKIIEIVCKLIECVLTREIDRSRLISE